MWNSLDLKCPIEDCAEYFPHDDFIIETLPEFVTLLTTAADTLTSEDPLWNEMKMLRNIQLKYKRILKCDKCLAFLQRVGHCLKKMVLLNLSKSYVDLAERFLVGQQNSITSRVPSRQQIEYVLIRTLTASKLVCEAMKYSQETFCYLIQKLKVGHLILDLVTATSITARVHVMMRTTLEQLCLIYDQVLSWRYKVKSGTFEWGQTLNLPGNIKDWLQSFEPSYLKPFPVSKADIDYLSSLLNSGNVEKESDSESVIVVDENSVTADISRIDAIDYGEVIARSKVTENCIPMSLTYLHESLLWRIVQVRSIQELESLWCDKDFCRNHFPKNLATHTKKIISALFARIKNAVSQKTYTKTSKKEPKFLKNTILLFCKHLGYTPEQVKMCKRPSNPSTDVRNQLQPVRTVKEFKIFFKQLREILKFSGQIKKLRKLRKIYRRRLLDIKLLKQNGEKLIARKLTFCTSKYFLAQLASVNKLT